MTPSKSTALVKVSDTSTGVALRATDSSAEFLLAGEDVTLHNREEVRKRLPDILGRALARAWLDDVFQGQLQEEYERGYADAVNALEKSITDERNQIQNLNSVLFEIHGEFEQQIKALFQEKIKCLALEFIGDAIDDDPEKLVVKIDQEVANLSKYINDLTVELNELDALAINANGATITDGQVKFVSNANLARGEFKLSDGFTTYSKTYSSE